MSNNCACNYTFEEMRLRRIKIWQLLKDGLRPAQIAEHLGVSRHSVGYHMKKMGVTYPLKEGAEPIPEPIATVAPCPEPHPEPEIEDAPTDLVGYFVGLKTVCHG